ncbi:uncharacterized protein F4822DRAFT_49123 [Hypoxylon trugodes]|uniref:uncharacterized protein n=1 Tax=Hypoxylon trugodes TaxID=326681 RepID=UPI0021996CFD|nr:uncharacterized protein F4822DRAFT_49123 [Hypoxylon trugodes]KAI1383736.1 hypothetical protein F4822DRAFT_49123 [Hypoxylon trugodes]
MASKFARLVGLMGALAPAFAVPTNNSHQVSLPLPARTIVQMNQTVDFVENIAVSGSGDLVVTLFHPTASVYAVEKPLSDSPIMSLLHTFQDANGTTGIVEINPGIFVVATAFYQGLATPVANTTSFWELQWGGKGLPATVRRIDHAPKASLVNGITSIPGLKSAVLAVDGALGLIYRVNVITGVNQVVLDATELKPVPGSQLGLGANGIKIRDGYVYWSNTDAVSIYRTLIDSKGYPIRGAKVEKVVTIEGASGVDDFNFDRQGNIWAATNLDNTVVTIKPDGRREVVVGSPTELTVAGDTAVAFGRTAADKDIVYVTTCGAVASPVNGTITEPGKIVAIDAKGYY